MSESRQRRLPGRRRGQADSHVGGEPSARNGAVIVVWRGYFGRPDALRALDVQPRYFGYNPPSKLLRPGEYVAKTAATLAMLERERPREVWLQLPPPLKLYAAAMYKRRHPEVKIVADCHNITLERPWINFPGFQRALHAAADVVLVHNDMVQERAMELGFPADRTLVLETRPALGEVPDSAGPLPALDRPWILVPFSFRADEPVEAVIEAAEQVPDITLVLTGDPRRAGDRLDQAAAPSNIVFTGFVDGDTYKALLAESDAVLGLTTKPDVQLSGANEAVGFGKPMVLSDTPVLRRLFPKGARYVGAESESIAAGLRAVVEQRTELAEQVRDLKAERVARWASQAEAVLHTVGREPTAALREAVGGASAEAG